MDGYVSGALPRPPKFPSSMDTTINPNYTTWQKQDNILLGWILSSLTELVLAQVAGLSTSASVWQALDRMFASKSQARIMQLKLELQTTKKGNLSMTNYLQKIKSLADSLAAVAQPILEPNSHSSHSWWSIS